MARRLQDNLTSSYFEAANRLNSRRARRRVVAYVESYDDVFFWRSVLSQFEDENLYFEIMLPSRQRRLERGKKAALMSALGAGADDNGHQQAGAVGKGQGSKLGQYLIACVDADYDYLEQGATETSQIITQSPYVFHTYAYAIENLQCYAPSLHNVCVAVTLNDRHVFDIERYLACLSEAIYPLFVWNIWGYRTGHYGHFTMTDFLRVIEPGAFTMRSAEENVGNIRRKAMRKVEQLRRENPKAVDDCRRLAKELRQLGVTPETTYLYIQGHHLFNKVVAPMLQKVCDKLVRQRQAEIARESLHGTQRRNELSCYNNSLADVTAMLKKNVGFMSSEPFRRMKADIERFVSSLNA